VPLQVAVVVPAGSQIVGHAIRRPQLRDLVGGLAKRLSHPAQGQHAGRGRTALPRSAAHGRLRLRNAQPPPQSPGTVVNSQSGVRQGDPLGPLLFSLMLQGPLEDVDAMSLARLLACDDIPSRSPGAYQAGIRCPPRPCSSPRPPLPARQVRCPLRGPCRSHRRCGPTQCEACTRGLLEAGTPVSTPAFKTANAETCATRACHLMNKLLALPMGAQDC
jgi:hypothetical protein